jgi:hypothetical protein
MIKLCRLLHPLLTRHTERTSQKLSPTFYSVLSLGKIRFRQLRSLNPQTQMPRRTRSIDCQGQTGVQGQGVGQEGVGTVLVLTLASNSKKPKNICLSVLSSAFSCTGERRGRALQDTCFSAILHLGTHSCNLDGSYPPSPTSYPLLAAHPSYRLLLRLCRLFFSGY